MFGGPRLYDVLDCFTRVDARESSCNVAIIVTSLYYMFGGPRLYDVLCCFTRMEARESSCNLAIIVRLLL